LNIGRESCNIGQSWEVVRETINIIPGGDIALWNIDRICQGGRREEGDK